MGSFNFNLWYDTYDPNFIEISQKSFIPEKWLSYQSIDHNKFDGLILKPINQYVEALYPMPQLKSIIGNTVTLTQRNHAEFFLLEKDNSFYNVDRPHMRQYYQTNNSYEAKGCFDQTYVFYVPWAIDEEVDVKFIQSGPDSPFEVQESCFKYNKIDKTSRYITPPYVTFKFKKEGSHMISDTFGKIKRNSPMFDIVFDASGIIIERVREFYEKN
jgi:hypothetical protein